MFNTPILLIIFNRPETTSQVIAAIRQAKPKEMFIFADGPRKNVASDISRCREARKAISKIDWPCKLKKLYQKRNLGCGLGPVTAINWFFRNVEQGIILEDDCVPNPSFFYFCQELLNYYQNNSKIMHISGNNFQSGKKRGDTSYYFSQFTHNWGWATWRRAWEQNNFRLISPTKRKHIWDKQWLISVKEHHGLAILPNVNLVTNIGSGSSATHTSQKNQFIFLPAEKINFPLIHPKTISQNLAADLFTFRHNFNGRTKDFIIEAMINTARNL